MGPVSFVMVVLGCAQGDTCRPVMTMPAAYQTEQACMADRGDIVDALSTPGVRLVAECRRKNGGGQTSAPMTRKPQAKPVA